MVESWQLEKIISLADQIFGNILIDIDCFVSYGIYFFAMRTTEAMKL